MIQDGENPDEYVFECGNASPKKRASITLQGNADEENTANENAASPEKIDSSEEMIDNVGENQTSEEPSDQDQDHIHLTIVDSDKLDSNTLDNEDSLNLTIGEDEAKIFQDEVNARHNCKMLKLIIRFDFICQQEPDDKMKSDNSK